MATKYRMIYPKLEISATLKLAYDDGLLRIEASSSREEVVASISFTDCLMVRIADEGVRLRLLQDLRGVIGFVMEDQSSDLIAWLDAEGLKTRDLAEAFHYLVFLGEEIVDVITHSQPKIEKKAVQ